VPKTFCRTLFALSALNAWAAVRATDGPPTLQEVTVTAQKVTESLQEVPISLSVVDANEIEAQRISSIEDLTRSVPNFSFTSNGNPGGSILEMRGISSAAGASPVAIYLDDVSITQRLASTSLGQPEPELLDIQQVEVLRGPQGTLYGASAEGGVLKFRSNPVDLQNVQGSALAEGAATEHGNGNYRANGLINMPIIEGTFGIRLAVQNQRTGGFIDQLSPVTGAPVRSNFNDHESTAARVAAEFRPMDQLSITAGLLYQRSIYGGTNTVTLGLQRLSTNNQVLDSGADKLIVPSLTIKLEGSWADLTSVTSDYTRSAPSRYDGTVFNSAYIGDCFLDGLCGAPALPDLNGNLSGSVISGLASPGNDTSFTRVLSQELRLSSKPYQSGSAPFTWVVGVYYQKSDDHHGDYEYIPQFNTVFPALYGTAALDDIFGGPLPNGLVYFGTYRFTEKQYSAFGDLTYHISDRFRASVGLRYLTARFDVTQNAGGFFNGGDSGFTAQSRDHALTPKASVQYDITDAAMAYATASKGFRLGGPNAPLISFCDADLAALGYNQAPNGYDHDSLWNYELGAKFRPMNRVSVNVAGFYDRWSQLQQKVSLPDCGSSFTTNLGAAHSYGAELDTAAKVTDGLTVAMSGGYTHATLTNPDTAGIQPGTAIEGVPDWSATASFEYQRPLSGDWIGSVRGNYSYVGDSRGSLISSDPDYRRPSYGIAGGSVGLAYRNWELSVFAKNLFNEQRIIQTPDHASVPTGLVLMPRTVGATISGHF
jgi:iron complex outermembrane recepter protein